MMDVEKLFKNIESLEHYIEITKAVSRKHKKAKIQLNMSTVLFLKKARFFEIEYFNECNGHGAAFIIFERLLDVGRSKTWGLLGKELVFLLQHWLDSTRKQLITMTKNWWSFMNLLLKFIKELRLKDSALPDLLVEGTAEPLLDLATRSQLDVLQRLDILYCLNLCCADSSREVRFATRHRLENYFVKLSPLLAKSGHAPTQIYMLETLLRWLLPRQNSTVRQAAAAKWFPDSLYRREAVDIFLERQWQNFYQDARDFINAQNQSPGLPTSVVYRQITIGTLTMECTSKRNSWIDINPATKSITILLEPRMSELLGVATPTAHTLVVGRDVVAEIKLTRVSSEVTISIKTSQPLHVYPSNLPVGDGGEVAIAVTDRNDLRKLDNALRDVFGDKYEVFIDFNESPITSPYIAERNKKIISSTDEDTRFSHPVRDKRRRISGCAKFGSTKKSPSTTSTTSLALLHDRLEALPKFRFNKEPARVVALPDLSVVSELTEVVGSQSIASGTLNSYTRGGFKSLKKTEKKSQSDGETPVTNRYTSPVAGVKECDPSCLLVATVGTDESVINDTIESLSKYKDNIVDLLFKEALQSKDDKLDSGIITGENRKSSELRDSDAIEDTPDVELTKSFRKKIVTIAKDDESQSNEIDESQYVSVRKKALIDKHKEIEEDIQHGIDTNERPTFDEDAIEKFFTEHITQNRSGELVVSPSLARKINETSSEGSECFKDCLEEEDLPNAENRPEDTTEVDNIQDAEIIDCLNNIIDKVCHDIEKCTEILRRDSPRMDLSKISKLKEIKRKDDDPNRVLTNIENVDTKNKIVIETPKKKPKQKKAIKLKFKAKKVLNRNRSQKQNNLESKMSPIPESKDSVEPEIQEKIYTEPHITKDKVISPEVSTTIDNIPVEIAQVQPNENAVVSPEISNVSPKSIDSNVPLIRKRRKLYSPKDEHDKTDNKKENTEKQELEVHNLKDDDISDFKSDSKNNSKYAATCYKDIENARKRLIRLPKSRKSKGKAQARSPSPKSKKIHCFDSLKTNVEEHVDVILASKMRSPSPRAKKMNELFDNLITNVEEHDDIIVADKKFNKEDLAIYNFTSDSDDEDFKKKKVELKKRFSTTTNASCDSVVSRHGRILNKINYSERSSDEKPKKTKSEKPKKNIVRRKKASQRRPHNLADEKMRDAPNDDLNISLVINKKDNELLNDPEPILEAPPQMELIDSEIDKPVTTVSRTNRTVNKKKKNTVKKETKHNIDKKIDNDDRTLSPLPGLVIEKMPSRKDDANESVCTQVMDKLKKIFHEGPDAVDDTNTTQNLLLDMDKVDFSHVDIFNDFGGISSNIPDIIQIDTSEAKPETRINNEILTQNVCNKIGDIVNISDVQSEKSIATVGRSPINAHGIIDEDPPDKIHLVKRVESRDLCIQDVDTSIQDYYFKLKEVIDKPANSSNSSSGKIEIDLNKKRIEKNSQCISPIAQMHEIKNDNKWLKSKIGEKTRKDLLEIGSQKVSPAKSSTCEQVKQISHITKIDLVERSSNSSQKCISPVVSLTKLSYDDISKWLPSRRNSSDSSHSSEKSKIIDRSEKFSLRPISSVNGKDNLRSVSQKIPNEVISSPKSSSDKQTAKENYIKPESTIKLHYNLRSVPKSISRKIIDTNMDCNNNDHNSVRTDRKTMISPVKLFEDLLEDNIPQTTEKENLITKQLGIKSPILNISVSSKRIKKFATEISSCESNISSSTRVDGKVSIRSTIKRKSDSPVRVYGKKRKTEYLIESGPSMSSVDDWLKKSAPIDTANSLNDSYGETLQTVMEKLDTTLAEIHQNTSKNFLHLFVEAQRHLSQARDERRRALKQVAADVLKEVVSILDRKFEDLDKRSQEMDKDFMEQLKSRAEEFIREDCKKKRVMVTLLREDIKATASRLHHQDTE